MNATLSGRPRIILALQGGGALGAYHIGAYQALAEAGYHPDWVTGISIGAINSSRGGRVWTWCIWSTSRVLTKCRRAPPIARARPLRRAAPRATPICDVPGAGTGALAGDGDGGARGREGAPGRGRGADVVCARSVNGARRCAAIRTGRVLAERGSPRNNAPTPPGAPGAG